MLFKVILRGFLFLLSVNALAKPVDSGHYLALTEETKLPKYENIVFHLRMPSGWDESKETHDVFNRPISPVRGVIAVGSWNSDSKGVKNNVSLGGKFSHLVQFADAHNMAVISWTNFKGYKTGVSGDEEDADQIKQYDQDYDQRAREWEMGFKRLCKRYSLPMNDVLYYGLSGGGQMGHRLALRKPEYFFAVHIHVNSSYDLLSDDGNDVLWLVTTGTREYGYPAGQRFYREALERGYHMIFRAEENLGHSSSDETNRLGLEFFEFCLKFIPDPTDDNWQKPPVDQFYFMKYPAYIGDYFNHEAFPVEEAEGQVNRQFMVALPTREIAEAWGIVWE